MMEPVPPWRYSVHNYQIFKLPHLQSIILQHYKHFINYLKHIRKKDGLAKMHCEVSGQVVFGSERTAYPNNLICRGARNTDRLDLVVKYEGLVINEEDIAHLFEEFRKLCARPTAGEASSGLGLSVAMKLAKQIGGEIFAESAGKNQGSTFKVGLKLSARN